MINSDKNQYEELCSYENIETAFNRAKKGKTTKPYVIKYEKELKENLLQLRKELVTQTYKPKPLETFILRDPKTRKISKSEFRDRVVHHTLCNIIEPLFDKTFISDSYANRIGKGTLNAVKRFDVFKRKVSQNNTIKCFVLKADIRHYFDTVDHQILINLLQKKIKDEKVMWLIKIILENHESKMKGKGMPLGNLTSQFFANIYLNELDQYVKHELKAEYYIRYVDDFVILHQSRKLLVEHKEKIDIFLQSKLLLELHPEKSKILLLDQGVGFLGFKIFYHYKILTAKNKRKFRNKLKSMRKDYQSEKIDREKIVEKFEGWLAHASNANTYKYRKYITSKFNQYFPVKKEPQIIQVKKHENLNKKIDDSKTQFTQQKTLYFINKGLSIKEIAEQRGLKEGTIWEHIANLAEHHQIKLSRIMQTWKVHKIKESTHNINDKLTEIKKRINEPEITFNEINCVLANSRAKQKKQSLHYYVEWYKKVNCRRKCDFNKKQRTECRAKFQLLESKCPEMKFTKNEFLDFIHNKTSICVLPESEKNSFVSWQEFNNK